MCEALSKLWGGGGGLFCHTKIKLRNGSDFTSILFFGSDEDFKVIMQKELRGGVQICSEYFRLGEAYRILDESSTDFRFI